MKLTIVLSTKQNETNWNAFRFANLALKKGDMVSVFLLGEAVEYDKEHEEQFDIKTQIDTFLQSDRAKIIACSTCMKIRHKQSTELCPMGGIADLYSLIVNSDKVLTF